ncbi:MAG: cyclic nucleotide-binding domain-containing protein [Okeania sp. SIO2H7]|nr:cyclic nucleotide-binding domain-containing protein [Okeania sp. SIO2H7]
MLEEFLLLINLSEEQLKEIENACEIKTYEPGEFLIREGEFTAEIYFLVSGEVNLYKQEPKTGENIKFKEMPAGESFGEMSFMDGSPRSCSIAAASPTKAYILSRERLQKKGEKGRETIEKLQATILYQVNNSLRYLTDRHIVSLQNEIDALKNQKNFGFVFIAILMSVFLATIINVVIDDYMPQFNVYSLFFNWIYALIILISGVLVAITKVELSWSDMGLTRKNLKKSLIDGVIFSLAGILVIFCASRLIDLLFSGSDLTERLLNISVPVASLIYLGHSFLQELARGITQISLQKFLLDEKGYYAILITAVLFSIFHVHLGSLPMLITGIASILFGIIYSRTYNLVGVTLVHFLLGFIIASMGLL